MSLTELNQNLLLSVARQAIEHGLTTGKPPALDEADYPDELKHRRATFVTLEIGGQLRGCIGSLEARTPLVADIAHNAYGAAFKDPRFPPLQAEEYSKLHIHLSILSPDQPMTFRSEQDLLQQLRPGIDGLILQEGRHRATFLPSVWTSLASPKQFLQHLKQKAGLPPDYWSDTIQASRYQTEVIG
ncbi:MAG: AMMECR1 domain-containing protein [Methylobacter sp.]|nr:MAG: AMMECR1 domain-containing protein [Methylobacter sp.]